MTNPRIHPLVRFAVERRVTMGMLLLGILVLGFLALTRLPLEFLPPISSSNISVSAPYASSSPDEVARRIVRPLEDSLGTLNGLDRLSSSANAEGANLNVTFVDGTDMDLAAVEVRDRVDRVRHLLPADLRQIRIRRFQTTDIPVMRFDLSSEKGSGWSEERLYQFAERSLQPRLERLAGVAQVSLRGLRTREVQIELDPDRLAAHGIDVREVSSRLRQSHLDLSAGKVETGRREFLVRVLGQLASLDEIRRIPLGDGTLHLGDVAQVTYDYPEQESFDYLNGEEALSVRLYKTSGANLLDVVEAVKEELEKVRLEPESAGLAMRVYHDSSVDVRKGLGQLSQAGYLGGGLAILAVFLFLRRVRTTLLVGIAIPVSVVLTFVLMFLLRQTGLAEITLNVVSLMGLVLALGMLVDNSIVVIESIYRRVEELGEDSHTAALRGASEVALPILASTATTLCVFIPLVFLRSGGGFFANYLREIGTTVCIVMVASLLVALTVVPMVAALLLARETPRAGGWLPRLALGYSRVLRFTLHHRLVFFVLAGFLLYGSWVLFGTIERSFGSRAEARQLTLKVDTPRNYSIEDTRRLFDDLYALVDTRRAELDIADISYSYNRGTGRVRGRGDGKELELYLVEEEEAQLSTTEVRDRVRELLPVVPGVELSIGQSERRHSSGGLQLELSGDDPAVLELLGREVAAQFAHLPGVSDVDLSLESGDDEVHVQVSRERALRLGLSSEAVANTVSSALSSRALLTLDSDDREVDVVLKTAEGERETLGQLANLAVHGPQGELPLQAVADFETRSGPRSIERENRVSKLTITCNTSSPVMARRAMFGAMQMMGAMSMPPGYNWSFGRWDRMRQQDEAGAGFALLFALLLVYMLMASLFESFGHPLSIMAAVPFAFIGVGVVMKLAGQPRDNFTELGFIILIGVVVNNAIVLIDHINRLREEGLEPFEAIITGGRHRLRAILMTAVTTILGLLPMVAPILFPQWFGPLEGRAATWAPVGLVILGGLTTSTFLTLLVVPTLYSLVEDVGAFFRRVGRAV